MLDVDRLKPINDAFGHAAGDQVLKAIVATLLRQVRASDVVGRLGGDEFAVLLWNLSETDARAKAASLEEAIDRLTFVFRGRTVTAGASAGVAILDIHSEAGRALEEADSADVCAQGAAAARDLNRTHLERRPDRPARCRISAADCASPNSPIMGSPVRLKATAPMLPAIRDIISARRSAVCRALAFLGRARNRRAAIVLQEGHCDVIGDIGHWFCSGMIGQIRLASLLDVLAGTQPADIAACNSSSSVSRYSFAMISALMVERRLPSHIAIA